MGLDVPRVKLLIQIDTLQDSEIQMAKEKKIHLIYFYHILHQV